MEIEICFGRAATFSQKWFSLTFPDFPDRFFNFLKVSYEVQLFAPYFQTSFCSSESRKKAVNQLWRSGIKCTNLNQNCITNRYVMVDVWLLQFWNFFIHTNWKDRFPTRHRNKNILGYMPGTERVAVACGNKLFIDTYQLLYKWKGRWPMPTGLYCSLKTLQYFAKHFHKICSKFFQKFSILVQKILVILNKIAKFLYIKLNK